MSITRINNPFAGEHVVGLTPQPAARVADWNRRLNLFSGRALSDTALTAEQEGRNGRVALAGQTVSAGVIAGLEVVLAREGDQDMLHIGPGYGIASSGEDVYVAAGARVAVRSIPVYTTAALLDNAPPLGTGALAARRLGASLAQLLDAGVNVPRAGILTLQPVQIDTLANFDPADPCQEDPSSTAFSDEQLIDGARIVYYAWPDEWLLLPAADVQWRNRLAFSIFDREQGLQPDEIMPWEALGLPIGLLALDDDFAALFVDRAAVVRQGGRARRHTAPTQNSGHEFLWQARIQQCAEHVASFNTADDAAADNPNRPGLSDTERAQTLAAHFRYLPPCGLLPKYALTFGGSTASAGVRVTGAPFFPGKYNVTAAPVPLEQLDVIARRCGPLADFDLASGDQVNVAVPVPQVWYEPDLLQVLRIDPVFLQTVQHFDHIRSLWLKRRTDVRGYYSLLVKAATGADATFPTPDPDAVEDEDQADGQIDEGIDVFKTPEQTYGTESSDGDRVLSVVTLKDKLEAMPGVASEVPQLDGLGLARFADLLQAKSDAANDHIDLGFLRVQTDIYRTRQKMLSQDAATRLAVSPALATIAQGVSAAATREDLEKVPGQRENRAQRTAETIHSRASALHRERLDGRRGRRGAVAAPRHHESGRSRPELPGVPRRHERHHWPRPGHHQGDRPVGDLQRREHAVWRHHESGLGGGRGVGGRHHLRPRDRRRRLRSADHERRRTARGSADDRSQDVHAGEQDECGGDVPQYDGDLQRRLAVRDARRRHRHSRFQGRQRARDPEEVQRRGRHGARRPRQRQARPAAQQP